MNEEEGGREEEEGRGRGREKKSRTTKNGGSLDAGGESQGKRDRESRA